jgi:hypothetical protein
LRQHPVLAKAFKAARTLNEAVCSLKETERERLAKLADRDQRLARHKWIRHPGWTVFLLDYMFSIAVGKEPPSLPGFSKLQEGRGRKRGTMPAFHDFVWGLLSVAEEGGGQLTLDKNRYFRTNGGTLVEALKILQPHFPKDIIPEDLEKHLSTLQRIKARRAKAQHLLVAPSLVDQDHK